VPGTTKPAESNVQGAGGSEVGAAAAVANPLVANLLSPEAGVRAATIEIISEAAAEGYDFAEEQPDANGDTVLSVLRQIAFGYRRGGEWLEPSEETRAAARNTISAIDPENWAANRPFIIADEVTPVAASESGRATVKNFAEELIAATEEDAAQEAAEAEASPLFEVVDTPAPAVARTVAPAVTPQPAPAPAAAIAPPRPVAAAAPTARGVVEMVDPARGTAMIRLAGQTMLPRGTRVVVYHKYVLGRLASVGEFEVTDAAPGMATVRGIAGTKTTSIAVGDQAAAGSL
jgi:hypothetical protein